MPNMIGDQSTQMKWDNERLTREAAVIFLRPLGKDKDVMILDDIDEMMSLEAFYRFDPISYEWMGTYLRICRFYFNRVSVFDTPEKKGMPNYMVRATKITTIGGLKRVFKFVLDNLRYSRHSCHEYNEDGNEV